MYGVDETITRIFCISNLNSPLARLYSQHINLDVIMYYHKVYMHNNKITKTIFWKCKTKNEAHKKFVKLRDSDKWDCIVVDDITEKEFNKQQ